MIDFNVRGYKYSEVEFVAVVDEETTKKSFNGLELRDFGLEGGEIHITPKASNRTINDPGVWYATKCKVDDLSDQTETRIGTLLIKQMGPDHEEMKLVSLDLEDLDTSHLIDRLVSECLHLHADTFGEGPYKAPAPKTGKHAKVKR